MVSDMTHFAVASVLTPHRFAFVVLFNSPFLFEVLLWGLVWFDFVFCCSDKENRIIYPNLALTCNSF